MKQYRETHTKTKFYANCGTQTPSSYNTNLIYKLIQGIFGIMPMDRSVRTIEDTIPILSGGLLHFSNRYHYRMMCGYAIPDIDFFPPNTIIQSAKEQNQLPQSPIYKSNISIKRGYGWFIFTLVLAFIVILYIVVNNTNNTNNRSNASLITTADTSRINVVKDTHLVTKKNERFNARKTILIVDNEQIPLSKFPDKNLLSKHKDWLTYNLSDIDGDSIPELLTEYLTGGGHCCSMIHFFQQVSKNTYKCIFTFRGSAGSVEINNEKLCVNFYEHLGYFYSCYACYIDLPNGNFNPSFNLVLKNNRLYYDKEDACLNERIIEDLEFLKNRELPDVDSSGFDDGTRKSYAEHIISYFFNNGQNRDSTKEVFEKYYPGCDSTEVWNLISGHINGILECNLQ